MIPVILSGGSGTRLWPLSRGQYPKQFLPLVSEHTLLQDTVLRLTGLPQLQPLIAVCNEDHRFMVAEQLREIGITPQGIILEPLARNTAPAIAMAALTANEQDILLVLPSDHVIQDVAAFHQAIARAKTLAEKNVLVTFGIVPTAPETGYGYIKRGEGCKVAAFVEKPNKTTAQRYLDEGCYLWNSGMFVFKAGVFLAELAKYDAEMLNVCREAVTTAQRDLDFIRINKDTFKHCPADSIDYAVMERTDKAAVVPLNAGWNDIGSWSALWDVTQKDENGNALNGDVMTINTENSFIYSDDKLVTVIGVKDLIVVNTKDALMIADKNEVQHIKQIVERLKEDNRTEAVIHRKVYRPWGHYDLIDTGERHHAKRIVVKPKASLSIQKHHHRSEHWVVVKGTAQITRGEETFLITENESTYIPVGMIHRLENPGVIPLEIIEVQSGSYLGEDDIVRFSDSYGRV